MDVRPGSTAVVLIDMQVDVLDALDALDQSNSGKRPVAAALVSRAQELVGHARSLAVPVMWVKVERRPDLMDQAELSNEQVRSGQVQGPRVLRRLIQGTEGAEFARGLAGPSPVARA